MGFSPFAKVSVPCEGLHCDPCEGGRSVGLCGLHMLLHCWPGCCTMQSWWGNQIAAAMCTCCRCRAAWMWWMASIRNTGRYYCTPNTQICRALVCAHIPHIHIAGCQRRLTMCAAAKGAPGGKGPEQGRIQSEGNRYLKRSLNVAPLVCRGTDAALPCREFPNLSYVVSARKITKDEL